MKERPILFNTDMVNAIANGTKTVTRRIIQIPEDADLAMALSDEWRIQNSIGGGFEIVANSDTWVCDVDPPCEAGDVLWVRETLYQHGELGLSYVADQEWIDEDIIPVTYGPYGGDYTHRKVPNIHMPKWACRLWLKVHRVRVEQLQRIRNSDAIAEGVKRNPLAKSHKNQVYMNYNTGRFELYPKSSFMSLWESIHGQGSWQRDPLVWVIEFEKIDRILPR